MQISFSRLHNATTPYEEKNTSFNCSHCKAMLLIDKTEKKIWDISIFDLKRDNKFAEKRTVRLYDPRNS